MTVNLPTQQEKIPIALVTEENQQQASNKTCSAPSRPRLVGIIEKYALVLAENLQAPRLLLDHRVTAKQLQSVAEADIASLRETIETDNLLLQICSNVSPRSTPLPQGVIWKRKGKRSSRR